MKSKRGITLVLGGAGSGKSRFALSLANDSRIRALFIATCDSRDKEMELKIKKHKNERPSHWKTLELSKTPFTCTLNGACKHEVVLIDSMTMWVAHLLMNRTQSRSILSQCRSFLNFIQKKFKQVIIVSDEVGQSIVPENKMARDFREVLGAVNQEIAKSSQKVFLVTAGIPFLLKGDHT